MLETKDLILRKAQFEDWRDLYHNIWSRVESARYMLWNVTKSEEDAVARMLRTLDYEQKHDTAYVVYEKHQQCVIGFAGINEIAPGVYEETGIAIGPEFTGKGYGKQIVHALVDQAFHQLGGNEFVYACRAQNTASRYLALSCGFEYTHCEERVDPRNGEQYILEFYKKVKENEV